MTKQESSLHEYDLWLASEYIYRLRNLVNLAQKRAWIQSMNMENDHMTGLLFNDLANLAQKIDVRLNIDGFNNMVTDGIVNAYQLPFSRKESFFNFRRQSKQLLLEELSKKGVDIQITN
ncbi:MAG: hypothetical protein COY81_04670 [Candidatus Pacebacteria bacterium CG_4_10_14_0_8_um_filter_43_12]|nr:MAG: hypothetical protein COU66_02000 [Candidatus Pacebacteria bacterium CG10_big_fil_rev_8_21_14_0_10_44_11]PIY79028.1 MAG: hypothetical protein COY81_04670 [Candidatus Pacebacteria bacterium CG_4_10_14_0_8_um_filter_43_12]